LIEEHIKRRDVSLNDSTKFENNVIKEKKEKNKKIKWDILEDTEDMEKFGALIDELICN
jgi:hypothetical protein